MACSVALLYVKLMPFAEQEDSPKRLGIPSMEFQIQESYMSCKILRLGFLKKKKGRGEKSNIYPVSFLFSTIFISSGQKINNPLLLALTAHICLCTFTYTYTHTQHTHTIFPPAFVIQNQAIC